MTEKTKKLMDQLEQGDLDSFKKSLLSLVSERIEARLQQRKWEMSKGVLEVVDPEAAKAAAEKVKADAETQALYVDPMMAKEFFLFDMEYKGHTITVKSLGTGTGKP